MDQVRFQLLGPMEMSVTGQPVKLPGAAERALMAQLLLAPGRSIAATLLVDRLWSESTLPVDPMNALQIRVSKLRRALKSVGLENLVVRDGMGYRAAVEPSQVDAHDFEVRLRQARAANHEGTKQSTVAPSPDVLAAYDEALALWVGEALSDFATEQWAVAEAARLSELKLAAMTERAQTALSLGRHVEVIAQLEPVVAQDPTLESMAGLLMVAFYRSGRQADALEAYRRTRDVLDESLGLEPSLSLRSLHERVLRQDASLGGVSDLAPPAPVLVPPTRSRAAEAARATNLPTVRRPLIGREEQLDALTALVDEARLVSLVGPGGAGKTSLALAAVLRVADDFPDGVFGVRLAPVHDADQVPVATADALAVPLDGAAGDHDVRERIISYLGRKQLLVLVDNCEHVIDAAASLIDDVLGRCPNVTVLATSREAPRGAGRGAGHRGAARHATGVDRPRPGARLCRCPALRRTGPRRSSRHGLRGGGPAGDRPDLSRAGRDSARLGARRRPDVFDVSHRHRRPTRPALLAADLRRPDRRGAPADAASHGRLELHTAHHA